MITASPRYTYWLGNALTLWYQHSTSVLLQTGVVHTQAYISPFIRHSIHIQHNYNNEHSRSSSWKQWTCTMRCTKHTQTSAVGGLVCKQVLVVTVFFFSTRRSPSVETPPAVIRVSLSLAHRKVVELSLTCSSLPNEHGIAASAADDGITTWRPQSIAAAWNRC